MATRSLDIDLSAFIHALESAPEVVSDAAKRGLHDALDEWKQDAVDLAPLYTRKGPNDRRPSGALRSSIDTEINGDGLDLSGEITAVAIEVAEKGKWAGKRFNYAYYLHEAFGRQSFKKPSTPGTIPKFLDKPAIYKGDDWVRGIENEIKDELKRKGW